MKVFLLLFFSFLIIGCIKTPNTPISKEILAQEKIHNNKTETEKAQEEYLRLQKKRENE